jgi:uncharacterized OB-fold protein
MRIEEDLGVQPLFEEEGDAVRLIGSRCRECGAVAFPPRLVCLECGGEQEKTRLSGDGVLHSFTAVANPPRGFEQGYAYGCVDLVEGPRILAALQGDAFRIGQAVRAVAAPVRDRLTGFRFEASDA